MTQQEVIKRFMYSLVTTKKTGTAAVDEAVRYATNNKFTGLSDFKSKLLSDIGSSSSAENFLRNYAGIILNNADTGAITGSDADNGLVKTGKSVIEEKNPVSTWILPTAGTTITLNDGITNLVYPSTGADGQNFTDAEKFIMRGLKEWVESSFSANKEAYNLDLTNTSCKKIIFKFVRENIGNAQTLPTKLDSKGYPTEITIKINMNNFSYITLEDEDGWTKKPGYKGLELDRSIAHEVNHLLVQAHITYEQWNKLPAYIAEGLAELVRGIDDYRTSIPTMGGNADYMEKLLADSRTNKYIEFSNVTDPDYSGGYIFLRHLAKQAADSYVKLFTGTSADDNFETRNDFVTISSAGGNDTIKSDGNKNSLNGGAGNDFLWLFNGTNLATIIGGKDDDTISLSSDTKNALIQYKAGDGNDLIKNISATATVSIEGEYTSTVVGNDRLLVVGEDTITVSNGANVNFTILNKVPQTNLIVGTEEANTINNTLDGATIQALGGNDSIYNGNYVNNVLIVGGEGNDTIRNKGFNVTIDGCANDDYIWNDASRVSIVGGSGNDKIYSYGANVTIEGSDGDDTIGNNSVYATNTTLLGGAGNDSINNVAANVSINAGNGDDTIINSNVNSNVNSGDSVTIDGGLGNDSISNSAANVLFVYTGGNDTITGFNSTSTLKIGDGFATYSKETVNGNVIVTVGKEKITLEGAAKLSAVNIMGEEKKVTVDSTRVTLTNASASKITLSSNVKYADASKRTKAIKITGNSSANTISGGSKNDTLDGGAGNDSILGGKGNDSLVGNKGNDTIDGGQGNDTLTGGAGKDLFIYSAGNDVITDYAAGDKISIGAAIAKTSLKGSDAIFTIGKNTLTVAKGKDKELTIIDAAGTTQTIIGGALLADNSTNKKTTLESWRTTADASSRTSAIQLKGNGLANTILGGSKNDTLYGGNGNDYLVGNTGNDKLYGQKGNDTLVGGLGNDSLWGDKGADVFLFENGDGKDVIFGFDNSDMLQITGAFSASYNKSKGEVYFKVGSTKNAITLKDFTATTFNVNGFKYKISGSKLVKK